MHKPLSTSILLFLSAVSLSAACQPGYQSATVLKFFDEDLSSRPSARPTKGVEEGQSPEPNSSATAQILIFRAAGKRYELLMPPSPQSQGLILPAGQEVCFREEGTKIRVMTHRGKALPGFAQAIPTLPQR